MKHIDVKSNSSAEYNVDSNAKYPKFKISGHVRIWKYKNIFLNDMLVIRYWIKWVKKRYCITWVNTFLNHMNLLEEALMS